VSRFPRQSRSAAKGLKLGFWRLPAYTSPDQHLLSRRWWWDTLEALARCQGSSSRRGRRRISAIGTAPSPVFRGGAVSKLIETVEKMPARNRRGGCLVTPDTGGCAAYQAGAACRASSWRLYAAAAMVNSSAAPARPRSLSVRSPRLRFRWPNTRSIRCLRRRACT